MNLKFSETRSVHPHTAPYLLAQITQSLQKCTSVNRVHATRNGQSLSARNGVQIADMHFGNIRLQLFHTSHCPSAQVFLLPRIHCIQTSNVCSFIYVSKYRFHLSHIASHSFSPQRRLFSHVYFFLILYRASWSSLQASSLITFLFSSRGLAR